MKRSEKKKSRPRDKSWDGSPRPWSLREARKLAEKILRLYQPPVDDEWCYC